MFDFMSRRLREQGRGTRGAEEEPMRFSVPSIAVGLGLCLLACSSDGNDGPEPFAVSEEAELTALAIDTDEPVADEGDAVVGDDEDLDRNEAQADTPDPDALENPVDDDPESSEDEAIETEDAKEDAAAPATTMSYHVTDVAIPKAEKRATLTARKWKCKRKTSRSCICKGSPMNCQFPSDQPGRNRYLPPTEVSRIKSAGETVLGEVGRWEVADTTPLFDGAGHLRYASFAGSCYDWAGATGSATKSVPGSCVKINFGQKKSMKVDGDSAAHTYVYAFSVSVPDGNDRDGKPDGASSWIPLSSVTKRATLTKMPNVVPPKLTGFAPTSYVLKSAEDWGQTAATYTAEKLPAWAEGKVAKGGGSHKAAGDYLLRDGNVLNLCYSTPGVGGAATDTLLVGPSTVAFRRVKSTTEKPTLIRVPVASKDKKAMYFAYGSINGRFGWVALASIKTGKVKEASAPPVAAAASCNGLPDGLHCDPGTPTQGIICANGAVRTTLACATAGEHCLGANADGTGVVCGP